MNKAALLALTIGMFAAAAIAPADAQTINPKAKEKVRWFTAPREIQIIDDRPIVKDFREAPSAASQLQLPPGPQGASGVGGGGAGALGGDDGGTIPAGGMPMGGGNQPAYRTGDNSNPVALPKSGFSGPSNIPARGMGPKGPLPGGYSSNQLAGKIKPWTPTSPQMAGPARGGGNGGGRPVANTPAATYNPGGGYGPSVGSSSGSGGGASTSVSAKLLRKIK